jgi:putative pyoverdin transport system ATP-binding/permease protein
MDQAHPTLVMNSKLAKLLLFLLRNSKSVVVLTSLAGIAAGVSTAVLMAMFTAQLSNPDNPAAFWTLTLLGTLAVVATAFSGFLSTHLAQRTSSDMRLELGRRILATPLRRVEEAGVSRIIATLTNDMESITNAFLRVPYLCNCAAVVTVCLVYMGWLSWPLLLTLLGFLTVVVVSYVLPANRANLFIQKGREEWDTLVNHYRALTNGAKELKLNRRRSDVFLYGTLQETSLLMQQESAKGANIYAILNSWTQLMYFIVIGVILFVLPGLISNITPQVLTGYAMTILYMSGSLMALVGIIPAFSRASIALGRIEKLGLTLADSNVQEEEADPLSKPPAWQEIELRGITHSYYREREASSFTLGPISSTISRGELIFLVGGNGSGKTTLAKLLCGLYIPESGSLFLDGKPITDRTRDQYRQLFSVVFSDFYLFEKLHGLEAVNLDKRAAHYIARLQLDHKVEVRDGQLSTVDLSQGQRKRLALLTAYLEDRPIYIFDEWAADQDPVFRKIFYSELLPELKAKGKTVVVISHDDRYYGMADRVVKLDYGQLAEAEDELELLADAVA